MEKNFIEKTILETTFYVAKKYGFYRKLRERMGNGFSRYVPEDPFNYFNEVSSFSYASTINEMADILREHVKRSLVTKTDHNSEEYANELVCYYISYLFEELMPLTYAAESPSYVKYIKEIYEISAEKIFKKRTNVIDSTVFEILDKNTMPFRYIPYAPCPF